MQPARFLGESLVFPGKLGGCGQILEQRLRIVVLADGSAQVARLLRYVLSVRGIIPKRRLRDFGVECRKLGRFVVDMQKRMRVGKTRLQRLERFCVNV